MATRQQTQAAIRKVMSNYPDTMLTTEQIANKAGVGYNTAKRALIDMGAKFSPVWPKRWTLKDDVPGTILPPQVEKIKTTGLPRVGSTPTINNIDVLVSTEPEIIKNWNAGRAAVAQSIANLDIAPTSNVQELIEMFNRLTTVSASIALALSESSTYPDWYGKIFDEEIDTELAP